MSRVVVIGLLGLLLLSGCAQECDCAVAATPTPTSPYAPIGLFETYVVAMDGATKDAFCADIADTGVISAADEFARLNNARPSEVYTLFDTACPDAPDRPE